MSRSAGYQDEMQEFVDEPVAGFVRDVRSAFTAEPAPDVEAAHLAAVCAALVDAGDLMPTRNTTRNTRRKRMLSVIFGTLAGKIAVATVAATAATGGLAATGSLPAPAQNAVSSAAVHVGLHLPRASSDEDPAPASEHGKSVSETAKTTDLTGREKGEQVSEVAGTNSAEHRKDAEHRATPSPDAGADAPPVQTGRPDDAGRPDAPGRPDDVGPGQDVPSNHPDGAGRP